MLVRVEAVTGKGRQVDAADEGHSSVDDGELLVMAVQRALACVQLHPDAGAADERIALFAHVAARRREQWQRRTGPGQHAHVRALRRFGEQLAQCPAAGRETKGRREGPAREQDGRLCLRDRGFELRQRLLTVDQHLDAVAVACGRVAGAPEPVGRRLQRVSPAGACQPAPVVRADEPLDARAELVVQPVDAPDRHRAPRVSAQTPERRR